MFINPASKNTTQSRVCLSKTNEYVIFLHQYFPCTQAPMTYLKQKKVFKDGSLLSKAIEKIPPRAGVPVQHLWDKFVIEERKDLWFVLALNELL
jgi:hypothetical protein